MVDFLDLLARNNYLRAPRTLSLAIGETKDMQIAGQFDRLDFTLRGTVTRSEAGVVSNKDVLEAIQNLRISSSIHGIIMNVTGGQGYDFSRSFYASTAFTSVSTGTTVTDVGYEFSLPIACEVGEIITIEVTWVSALTTLGTSITGYPAILKLTANATPAAPEVKVALRYQNLGSSGVIGASEEFSQATIPIVRGFNLCGFLIQTNTTARGTYTNAIDKVQLTNGGGNYKVDEWGPVLRHRASMENQEAIDTGRYPLMFAPFANSGITQLNIINGGVATVGGSEILYIYCRVRTLEKTYSIPQDSPLVAQAAIDDAVALTPGQVTAPQVGLHPGYSNLNRQGGQLAPAPSGLSPTAGVQGAVLARQFRVPARA
ncbi:hypothetical protein ES703_71005 [subsurface metagenome]